VCPVKAKGALRKSEDFCRKTSDVLKASVICRATCGTDWSFVLLLIFWSFLCVSTYQLMSLTYRICFISLPIPVMGPEGSSKFLVLSWELAFYEISVASQNIQIFIFLEWFTFLVFDCLIFHCFVTSFHMSQE